MVAAFATLALHAISRRQAPRRRDAAVEARSRIEATV
jgi:hypothetical protein